MYNWFECWSDVFDHFDDYSIYFEESADAWRLEYPVVGGIAVEFYASESDAESAMKSILSKEKAHV